MSFFVKKFIPIYQSCLLYQSKRKTGSILRTFDDTVSNSISIKIIKLWIRMFFFSTFVLLPLKQQLEGAKANLRFVETSLEIWTLQKYKLHFRVLIFILQFGQLVFNEGITADIEKQRPTSSCCCLVAISDLMNDKLPFMPRPSAIFFSKGSLRMGGPINEMNFRCS